MDNHQLFDCFTAQILGKLYEVFPQKHDFWIHDFDVGFCVSAQERDPSDEDEKILEGTFVFLQENGLISFDTSKGRGTDGSYGVFSDTGLTLKGLKLLNKVPQSIVKEESIGEKIVATLHKQGPRVAANLLEKGLWGLMV